MTEKAVRLSVYPSQTEKQDENLSHCFIQTLNCLLQYMAASVPGLKKHRGHKLPVHGNERTMNLNHMVLANITESAYFRCDLIQIKTYDEMIDEIYYKVTPLEPWEKVGKDLQVI